MVRDRNNDDFFWLRNVDDVVGKGPKRELSNSFRQW